jgi:hypothetical protein
VTLPGAPQVTISAQSAGGQSFADVVRIGVLNDVQVRITRQDGTADVTGALGAGAGALSGGGGAVSLDPNTGEVVVTYTFTGTGRGPNVGEIPFEFTSPGANGTLVLTAGAVGPEFGTNISMSGIDFGAVPAGETRQLHFTIGNYTTDTGPLDLVGLSLLELSVIGDNASLYSIVFDDPEGLSTTPGTLAVLAPGEELGFTVVFLAPEQFADWQNTFLRIVTDQFAMFGRPGLVLVVSLGGRSILGVDEPTGLGFALLLAGGAVAGSRRFRR